MAPEKSRGFQPGFADDKSEAVFPAKDVAAEGKGKKEGRTRWGRKIGKGGREKRMERGKRERSGRNVTLVEREDPREFDARMRRKMEQESAATTTTTTTTTKDAPKKYAGHGTSTHM